MKRVKRHGAPVGRVSALLAVLLCITATFPRHGGVSAASLDSEAELPGAVLVGREDNWGQLLSSNSLVLAGFFAPWCGHCKKLKPHWNELAEYYNSQDRTTSIDGEDVSIVAVDVVDQPSLYWQYDIQGYPTLKLFRKGVEISNCDGRSAESIGGWLEARRSFVASSLHRIDTMDDALALRNQHQTHQALRTAVIGVFRSGQDDDLLDWFKSLAMAMYEGEEERVSHDGSSAPKPPPFGVVILPPNDGDASTGTKNLLSGLNLTAPSVVALRAFADTEQVAQFSSSKLSSLFSNDAGSDANVTPFGARTLSTSDLRAMSQGPGDGAGGSAGAVQTPIGQQVVDSLKEWVQLSSYPDVMPWNTEFKPYIFAQRPGFETHVLLMLPKSAAKDMENALVASFRKQARSKAGKALFLVMRETNDGQEAEREEANGLMDALQVPRDKLPSLLVVGSSARDNTVSFFRNESLEAQAGLLPLQLDSFIQDFFAGKVPSSKMPQQDDGSGSSRRAGDDPSRTTSPEPSSAEAQEVDESDVHVLRSESSFDTFLSRFDVALIEAYAPWCGHCKKLKPAYARVATELSSRFTSPDGATIAVAKFDATAPPLKELAQNLGIEGFPSLFMAHAGVVWKYDGERTEEALVAKMTLVHQEATALRNGEREAGAALCTTEADLAAALKGTISNGSRETTVLLLAIVPVESTEESMESMREGLSNALLRLTVDDDSLTALNRRFAYLVTTTSAAQLLTQQELLPGGSLDAVQTEQSGTIALLRHTPSGPGAGEGLLAWSPAVVTPPGILHGGPASISARVMEVVRDTFRPPIVIYGKNQAFEKLLEAPHIKQVLLFDHFSELDGTFDLEDLIPVFEPLVHKYNRQFAFVLVDSVYTEALEFFKLTPTDMPASRLVEVQTGRSFLVDTRDARFASLFMGMKHGRPAGVDELLVSLDESLAMAFHHPSGRIGLPAIIRSQPVQESRLTTPLKKIVGDQWKQYVLDLPQFDVLVEYFDPSCPHCKKMQPILDTLAAAAFDDGKLAPRGHLVMIQLDITANDPQDWDMPPGVPTLHFYPAVSKDPNEAKRATRRASSFIPFTGSADRRTIIDFVELHATHTPVWSSRGAEEAAKGPASSPGKGSEF